MTTGTPLATSTDDDLAIEQARLERSGKLQWMHWLIIAGSLAVTVMAWKISCNSLQERMAQRFDREAERVVELFTEQLHRHADILQATAGFLSARDGTLSAREWRRYTRSLDLSALFPALAGFGVIHYVRGDELSDFLSTERERNPGYSVFPEHDQPFHLPMVHVSPASIEARVLGMDSAHNPERREAIKRAVSAGRARITAPIALASSGADGIVMYVPFYRGDEDDWRRAGTDGMAGVVVGGVRAENVAAGVLDRDKRLVWVRISDQGKLLYDEHDKTHEGADVNPMFTRSDVIDLFGRRWQFEIETTAAFRDDAASVEPTLILAGGLLIDALLFSLFIMLSRARREALWFAERTASGLRAKSQALEESNRELESFAYVVSHDLKAPLRGISDLVGYLEEDLEHYLEDDSANPDVARNISRIHRQTGRASALIGGILTYSRLGTQASETQVVDTRELIEQIGDGLGVDAGQLILQGNLPVLDTQATRLEQVLANLISNAFKYHHDPDTARVLVAVTAELDQPTAVMTTLASSFPGPDGRHQPAVEPTRYRFTVTDNGPGIDARFHERIFELFSTLQPRDTIESTGVGLSIVKKTVELMGGSITVFSVPGEGARFSFDWPAREVPESFNRQLDRAA